MSKVIIGWKAISELTPFSESTVRKRLKPGMIKACAVYKSRLGRQKRWAYWTTENLIERYLIALSDKNDGEI
jgi:hypothetical protein